jgi:spore germination cell wall hydrolase CwlJ-like protein
LRTQRELAKSLCGIFVVGISMAGCTTVPQPTAKPAHRATSTAAGAKVTYNYTQEDRECLKRAMYSESEHSDRNGYLAVGTVVANRLTSPAYPKTICGVVSQEKQFAPGVMTRAISPISEPDLDAAADAILLRGERHPALQSAMFFHTQGLKYGYRNMHYVAVAGGNAFYEKRARDGSLETPAPLPAYEVAMNYVPEQPAIAGQFDVLLPVTGPIPTLIETPATAPVVATSSIPDAAVAPPTTIAVPTPRPAFDTAYLRLDPEPAAVPVPMPAAAAAPEKDLGTIEMQSVVKETEEPSPRSR